MTSGRLNTRELRFRGMVWHVAVSHIVELGKWLSDHFPGVLDREDCLLKKDVGSRVAAVGGLVVKESSARRGRSKPRFGLRLSASRRAFVTATDLLRRGVRTPHPVAWTTVRKLGFRVKDFLVAEEIAPTQPLKARLEYSRGDPEYRARLMEALGRLLASFHLAGYSNRDLKDTNILVAGEDGLRLWAVDLDGVRRTRITRSRIIKDLWPIVRSLKMNGLGTTEDKAGILQGYNEVTRAEVRLEDLPANY